MPAAAPQHQLDVPYRLAAADAERFRRDGCIRLPGVLDAGTIAAFEPELTRVVEENQWDRRPLSERTTYGRAFVQVGNLWKRSAVAERFVRSTRLARLAAELLGCPSVRLYHDQALYKEAGGGHTPWHCDQQYWPLDNPRSVTVWIPLQEVPLEMGPLAFAPRSHEFTAGRALPISDESEETLARAMADNGYPPREEAFALGDASFHLGWTYHRARGNATDRTRKVMTIIYMDAQTRVAQPETPSQESDRQAFFKDLPIGALADTPLTPVLWPA